MARTLATGPMRVPFGLSQAEAKLAEDTDPSTKAVMVVHSETTTGSVRTWQESGAPWTAWARAFGR